MNKNRFSWFIKTENFKRIYYLLIGFFSGLLNGFFGSGGGMICVPMLKKAGLEQKKAHATSISIIFPLTVFSAIIYLINKDIKITNTLNLIIPSLLGALCGSLFLKKISNLWLKRIFGLFIVFVSLRMLFA
ncbi:MAG: sulfite exporter TauE/SafE family protein [Oscillospiraceae bacterium]